MLKHPHLSVVNALPECEGLITRRRTTNGIQEESILDFFIVCDKVLPYLKKMVIDEDKSYVLTNYKNVKNGGEAIDSDHLTQYMDLDLKFESEKPKRVEIYNFKNEEAQIKFNKLTSETEEFSKCFMDDKMFPQQIVNWRSKLESFCKQ